VIVLTAGSFTDETKPKPVVWYWMQNSRPGADPAPYDGRSQPNANCNQIFQGIDIRIEQNNRGAMGIRARGAQMVVVLYSLYTVLTLHCTHSALHSFCTVL
jgi:hypothetical protein